MMHQTVKSLNCIIVFSFLVSISCNSQVNVDYTKIKKKIVYVEEHKKGSGINNNSFGDVVIFDLDTRKKYKITDDNYFDKAPLFSPDGKYLLIQTLRDDDMFGGIGGPYELFLYNLADLSSKKLQIPYQLDRPEYMRYTLEYINFTKDNNLMFTLRNQVVKYYLGTDSLEAQFVIDDDYNSYNKMIYDIILSPENNKVVFGYTFRDKLDLNLGFYSFHDSSFNIVKRNVQEIYCWSKDETALLVGTGGIIRYNINKNESTLLYDDTEKLTIRDCKYLDNENVVCLVGNENREYSCELAIYNLKTKTFDFLTNDGLQKEYLDVNVTQD